MFSRKCQRNIACLFKLLYLGSFFLRIGGLSLESADLEPLLHLQLLFWSEQRCVYVRMFSTQGINCSNNHRILILSPLFVSVLPLQTNKLFIQTLFFINLKWPLLLSALGLEKSIFYLRIARFPFQTQNVSIACTWFAIMCDVLSFSKCFWLGTKHCHLPSKTEAVKM